MAESKAATQGDLEELHRAVAEALMAEFAETTPCPHCRRKGVSPAMLKVAARFLAQNGISVDAAALADVRRSLSELTGLNLPFKSHN
jgi:hypothetical protein